MKTYEFWRERATGHIWAVELVEGAVVGSCTPIHQSELDERFLGTFEYVPSPWLEAERDEFDLYAPVGG